MIPLSLHADRYYDRIDACLAKPEFRPTHRLTASQPMLRNSVR